MSDEKPPVIKISESPDFKSIYITGVAGVLSPEGGSLMFYADRAIPKMVQDAPGGMKIDYNLVCKLGMGW